MAAATAEPSDETLAARAAAGDDSAFEAIVERYQARVFRLACRLTSDTDAPDVLQETFLQVYRHLPSFRGESQFGTWLYRIATNAALMHRRASARRPAEPLDAFLPRFDAQGSHLATPAELQVAACADELLDRQFLAGKGSRRHSRGCPTCIATRSCCATSRRCPPPMWRTRSAWSPRRCGSASTAPG